MRSTRDTPSTLQTFTARSTFRLVGLGAGQCLKAAEAIRLHDLTVKFANSTKLTPAITPKLRQAIQESWSKRPSHRLTPPPRGVVEGNQITLLCWAPRRMGRPEQRRAAEPIA